MSTFTQHPLFAASRAGDLETVCELLTSGADVNMRSKNTGETPLFVACNKGHLKIVQKLLEHSANVNLTRNDGCTPRTIAFGFGYDKILVLLTERGAVFK